MMNEIETRCAVVNVLISLAIVIILSLSSGCATIKTFNPPENAKMKMPIYIGTQYNLHKIMNDDGFVFGAVDFIPSVGGDTLLFPGHVVLYYVNDNQPIAGPYRKQ